MTHAATTGAAIDFKLRAGFESIDIAAAPTGLAGLIEKANQHRHIEGLPDDWNPEVIDVGKATALVASLPGLPAATLHHLAGHALYLDAPGLKVRAVSPTRVADFAKPFTLTVDDVQGETILAHVTVAIDCDLARQRSAEAQDRVAKADAEVKSLEGNAAKTDAEADAIEGLSLAKARRFAIARVWRENAADWTRCLPADAAAKSSLHAAEIAVKSFIGPPRSGMPQRG